MISITRFWTIVLYTKSSFIFYSHILSNQFEIWLNCDLKYANEIFLGDFVR